MKKLLSNFLKMANTRSVAIRPIEYPNNTIDIGVVHQVYGALPQLKFFNPELQKSASINTTVDTSYSNETGKGKIDVPNSKDFYIGEGV